ncbi:MAG: toll/interleukin-1 receptor domain-containing protein [[Clostridium] symbiosum]
MPTIFLSHTSIDKPFVEKLARDLQRLGISVWYDKYEIKFGESLSGGRYG